MRKLSVENSKAIRATSGSFWGNLRAPRAGQDWSSVVRSKSSRSSAIDISLTRTHRRSEKETWLASWRRSRLSLCNRRHPTKGISWSYSHFFAYRKFTAQPLVRCLWFSDWRAHEHPYSTSSTPRLGRKPKPSSLEQSRNLVRSLHDPPYTHYERTRPPVSRHQKSGAGSSAARSSVRTNDTEGRRQKHRGLGVCRTSDGPGVKLFVSCAAEEGMGPVPRARHAGPGLLGPRTAPGAAGTAKEKRKCASALGPLYAAQHGFYRPDLPKRASDHRPLGARALMGSAPSKGPGRGGNRTCPARSSPRARPARCWSATTRTAPSNPATRSHPVPTRGETTPRRHH